MAQDQRRLSTVKRRLLFGHVDETFSKHGHHSIDIAFVVCVAQLALGHPDSVPVFHATSIVDSSRYFTGGSLGYSVEFDTTLSLHTNTRSCRHRRPKQNCVDAPARQSCPSARLPEK